MVCAARSTALRSPLLQQVKSKPSRKSRPSNSTAGLVYRRPPPWAPAAPEHEFQHPRRGPGPKAEVAAEKLAIEQLTWPSLPAAPLELRVVDTALDASCVPPLAHGLDVVLRERGVHPIVPIEHRTRDGYRRTISEELRQRVALHKIAQPDEIDWANIPPYVRASEDVGLRKAARNQSGVRYSASTSSMTKALSVLYHAVSNFRDTWLRGGLTSRMSELPVSFTKHHNKPAALLIRPYPPDSEGDLASSRIFSIDSQEGEDRSPAILRDLGHSMERMLTMTGPEFREKMLLKNGETTKEPRGNEGYMDASASEARARDHPAQFYHYSQAESFLLRAQIDCRDPDTGHVFDLKTRAVAAVRYNIWDYRANSNWTLRRLTGVTNSYEREFYDMVRSVFLKYALQLRIGRMSGAFVTYHNTSRVLGFEFLPLSEMEAYVFGSEEWAKGAFSHVIRTLGIVLDEVTASMPVAHPGFLKVVLAPRQTQRTIDIYVQRVSSGQEDILGPSAFSAARPDEEAEPDGEESLSTAVLSSLQQKMGSMPTLLNDPQSRISMACAGGNGVLPTLTLPLPLVHGAGNSEVPGAKGAKKYDRRKSAQEYLAAEVKGKICPQDLRCFSLRLAPCINGEATRMPFEVKAEDSFALKFDLSPAKIDKDFDRLLRDFVQVLDEAYD